MNLPSSFVPAEAPPKPSLRAQRAQGALASGRTAGTAYVLSAILPGLGHFYFELLGSGILLIIAAGAFFTIGAFLGGAIGALLFYLVVWLGALVDINFLATDDQADELA